MEWAVIALIGLLIGAGAYAAMPGKVRGGILLTMLVGAVAAVVTTWIGAQIGIATQGTMIAYFFAAIGTGLVLAVWRMSMGGAA
ncbi:GlsB/YeaQ/YmgE family stress response membrane protein [Sphingomonas sp. LaA6.9]|uniref:GlsB/YeaQ/YmgE family stress response membrane protein n=1 Tax=Sphingomonas sp. LaA6.9 TaxID=2919914 RepID=UPI001F4F1289|nr:hypothetical protein [Sphingomonas sp. LaA6.9]MCJ8158331.1 hypothetical protein [Sphingomonas sp. LaA6.9]